MIERGTEKAQDAGGVTYRYSTDWIRKLEGETHWRLYWRQQQLMDGLVKPDDELLEIGVGTQFTANYLRSKGVTVSTLDIDAEKQPDIVANVAAYDFPRSYDAILAFEVFEHLPFDDFRASLGRLAGASRRHVFLSLPRNRKVALDLRVKLPKLRARQLQWRVRKGRIDEPYHVWEIDHGDITVESLEREFAAHGLRVERRNEAFDRLFYALACSG